ncbi:MAG: phosphate/phosphite/phosphonate ABC transporter substrate-binding protein [Anaerolineae bacterium]|nr:phosphate/phosphite/phosphonate ABC transporter substrate-binding protein [Anaerolineae bacterium]
MAFNPGDTLLNGQYCILRLLGRGGFGFVYQAEDTHLKELVAIKELIPGLIGDDALLKRFLAEAKATMRMTSKHIVRTYHIFPEGANYYIVMEYMAGGSLEDRLREYGALPVDEAVRIAAEVCQGLACAHDERVVHCDLKPANILFDAKGQAKIADFGIAHISGEMHTRSWMTPTGFVAGTLPYMSPEQADGIRDEPRLDLYALGAVLYRMLTGRTYLDFEQQETPRAQAENVGLIYSQEIQPPSLFNSKVPAWLDTLVLQVLAKRPEDRPQSARELQRILQQNAPQVAFALEVPQHQPVQSEPVSPPNTARQSKLVSPPNTARQSKLVSPPRAARPAPQPAQRAPLPSWFWSVVGAAAVLFVLLIVAITVLVRGGSDENGAGVVITTATLAMQSLTSTPELEIVPTETIAPISTPTDASLPALGTQMNPLVISLAAIGDTQAIFTAADRLAEMVTERSGLVVVAQLEPDYAAVYEAVGSGRAHIAWLNAAYYLLAHEEYGVNAALIITRSGLSYYAGQVVVRADSGITSLEDLKGKAMCWVDPDSTSGYIIPRVMLLAHGINPERDFERIVFAGSHNNVIRQVYNRECDAGATYADARSSSIQAEITDLVDQVVVLATTVQVPNDSLSFTIDVFPIMREQITMALLAIAETEEGGAVLEDLFGIAGVKLADDSAYDPLRRELMAAGADAIDLVR